jgi:hypothetical protein
LGAAARPPLVSRFADVSYFITAAPPVLERTSLEAAGPDQSTPPGLPAMAPPTLSTSASAFTTAASPNARATFLHSPENADDESDMPHDPLQLGPFIPMGPAPGRSLSPTNNDDDQATDMSYAGPLESIEVYDGFSTWTATTISTGRATGHALSFVVSDPSLQIDARSEVPSTSGLSYLAKGGGTTLYSPTSAGDDVLTGDDGSTDPI